MNFSLLGMTTAHTNSELVQHGTLLPNWRKCHIHCQPTTLFSKTEKFLLHVTHLAFCHWIALCHGTKSFPLYSCILLVLHTRCFSKSQHMTLHRKLTLDNVVCVAPPVIFHSLPSSLRIEYSLVWTHPISWSSRFYFKKKKKRHHASNYRLQGKGGGGFHVRRRSEGSFILQEDKLQTRNPQLPSR